MVVINRKDNWWHLGLSEHRGSSNPPMYEYVHVLSLFQNCGPFSDTHRNCVRVKGFWGSTLGDAPVRER